MTIMARVLCVISGLLTLGGMGSAIFGILEKEGEPIAVGAVLILGAAVFATMFVGARKASGASEPKER